MKKILLTLVLGMFLDVGYADTTHVACTFNGDGEITSGSDCSTTMLSFTVRVKDVLLCSTSVTPSTLSSCSSMGIAMTWTATPTTVTQVIPSKHLATGTYNYLAVVYDNVWSLAGKVSFATSKNGATTSGKYCHTRGISINFPGHDWSSRSNYAAECLSSVGTPEVLTWTVNSYDNSGSVFTETNTSVNGLIEKNYLMTSSNTQSTSPATSARVLTVSPLQTPITVTHNKLGEDLGLYVFDYQLSYGLKVNYDGVNQKSFVPGQIDVNVTRQ